MKVGTGVLVTCDRCGEEGEAIDTETVASAWIVGRKIRHSDPNVCIENLRSKLNMNQARGNAILGA